LIQKSVARKKYATRDEDLFSDTTDIFAGVAAPTSSQLPTSSTNTTDGRLQLPNNDDDDDGDYLSHY